ncbi:MAG: AraC family transcriptional regulator [Pseudobdellovibrionaceae bacterium]
MKNKTVDIVAEFPGVLVIHQKIPGHEVGRHSHKEHEFFVPLQGEITVQYKDKTVKAGPGRMLYVPPNLDHSFSSTAQGSGERVILLINSKLWQKHVSTKFEPSSLPMNSLAKELMFYVLIHQKIAGAKYFISALVETLVESLNSVKINESRIYVAHIEGKLVDNRIRKAVQLINENVAEISVSAIARQSGLSQRNLSRLFMQETGLTPKDYVILKRMDKAKVLLKETKLTITDISLEVGYNSLSKFIETFRKIEGILPSDFRNNSIVGKIN